MNLVSEMKKLHIRQFREGKIKQASLLKSFKEEILELVALGYKPSEIKDFLEEKLKVEINMNTFYSWLRYTRQESSTTKEKRRPTRSPSGLPSSVRTESGGVSALDILNDTQFD